jgi:hypothetical protein
MQRNRLSFVMCTVLIGAFSLSAFADTGVATVQLTARDSAVEEAIAVIGLPADAKAAFVDSVTASSPARAEDSMSTAYVIGLHAGKKVWRIRFDSVVVDMSWAAPGATLCCDITAFLEAESGRPILIVSKNRNWTPQNGVDKSVCDTGLVVRAHERFVQPPAGPVRRSFLSAIAVHTVVSPGQAAIVTAIYGRLFCNKRNGDEAWLLHLDGIPGGPLDDPGYPPTTSWWLAVGEDGTLWNANLPCGDQAYMGVPDQQ